MNLCNLSLHSGGGGGGGGGNVFLGNPLWRENLSLGYSLPWRKYLGAYLWEEVLPCDARNHRMDECCDLSKGQGLIRRARVSYH